MPQSNYQEAVNNWTQRAQQYEQLGIPRERYVGLMQSDLEKVIGGDSTPMSTTEANVAVLSQLTGKSNIGNPTPKHHGILGDIETAVTSVPSDIKDVLSNFISGSVNFVHHLPSETVDTGEYLAHTGDADWLTSHGYQDPNGEHGLNRVATDIRNMSKAPLLNMLPGISDIAQSTTAAGRQNLYHHPVGALLDVAPLLGAAGKAGAAAKEGYTGEAAQAGTAMESLTKGNPYRAAARATLDTTAKIPGIRAIPLANRAFYQQLADEWGVSAKMRGLFNTPLSKAQEAAHGKMVKLAKIVDKDVGTIDPDHLAQLSALNNGEVDASDVDPVVETMYRNARQVSNLTVKAGEAVNLADRKHGIVQVPVSDHVTVPFAADSKVVSQYRAVQRMADSVQSQASVVDRAYLAVHASLQAHPNLDDPNLPSLTAALTKAKTRFAALQDRLESAQNKFHDTLASHPPAAYHPRIKSDIKRVASAELDKRAGTSARLGMHATQLSTMQDRISEAGSREDMISVMGEETYKSIEDAATRNWLHLAQLGLDPVWMKHIEPGEEKSLTHPQAFPDRIVHPEAWRDRVFDFSPQLDNVAVGVLAAAKDVISSEASAQLVKIMQDNFGELKDDVWPDFENEARLAQSKGKLPPGYDLKGYAQKLLNEKMSVFDPSAYGGSTIAKYAGKGDILIPSYVKHNLDLVTKGVPGLKKLEAHGAYDKAMHVFRFSVLTGPRHLVHVGIGGLMQLELSEPLAPLMFGKVIKAAHRAGVDEIDHPGVIQRATGKLTGTRGLAVGATLHGLTSDSTMHGLLPVDVNQHLYSFEDDQILNFASGKSLRSFANSVWQHSGGSVERGLARMESAATNLYRASAYLTAAKRGMAHGLDESAAVDKAVTIANRTVVNMNDMSVMERSVIRNIMPFYAFTKFLFQYLLAYPVDHPMRVSILTNLAEQQQEEWNSLIPQRFQQLLFLGKPDANGNVNTIDYKNFNPFRSFSNDFTIAGFFSDLNPVITAPFAARGFNTLSGVGQLYPQIQFNVQTGTLQAAPPGLGDEAMSAAETFVPELGALDHFVGITSQMRYLKKYDPSSYRSTLWSELNIPLAYVNINLPYTEEKQEIARYQAAKSAVTSSESTGDFSSAEQFNLVPYNNQLVSPETLANEFNSLTKQIQSTGSDINAAALLTPPPEHKVSDNPLELVNGGQ